MSEVKRPEYTRGYEYGSLIGFLAALTIALVLMVINNLRLEQKLLERNLWIRDLENCKASVHK